MTVRNSDEVSAVTVLQLSISFRTPQAAFAVCFTGKGQRPHTGSCGEASLIEFELVESDVAWSCSTRARQAVEVAALVAGSVARRAAQADGLCPDDAGSQHVGKRTDSILTKARNSASTANFCNPKMMTNQTCAKQVNMMRGVSRVSRVRPATGFPKTGDLANSRHL